MVRVGLIGFGLAGRAFHAPLIAATPGMTLAGVVTSRAGEMAAAFPGVPVLGSADALFADPGIDLVVVATPNDTHLPLGRAALAAGKHVVIDKPVAPDPAGAAALAEAAQAAGRLAIPFHNRRWDGDFLTLAALLAAGTLGEVMLAELRWDRFRPAIKPGWRERAGEGAGLLADLGPHLIDQAIALWGMPDAVSADIACQRDGAAVDDYFEVTLHHGRARVVCAAASLVAAGRPRFAVHGTGGSFVKYGIDPQEAVLRAGGGPDDPGYGEEPAEAWGRRTDANGAQSRVPSLRGDWRRFYAGVVSAVEGTTPPPVAIDDAVAGLRVIALARIASETGCRQPFAHRATPPST